MAEEVTNNQEKHTTASEDTFAHKVAAKLKKVSIALIIVIAIAVAISIFSERKEAAKIDSWNKILQATFTAQTELESISTEVSKATAEIPGTTAAQYGDMLVIGDSGITYDKEKLEMAKKAAEDFIKTDPKNPFINQVKLDYGTVLFNLGDYDGAIKEYQEVINSKEKYLTHEALLYKGITQEKLGKDSDAIATYTSVIDDVASKDNPTLLNFADYARFARTQLQSKKTKN